MNESKLQELTAEEIDAVGGGDGPRGAFPGFPRWVDTVGDMLRWLDAEI